MLSGSCCEIERLNQGFRSVRLLLRRGYRSRHRTWGRSDHDERKLAQRVKEVFFFSGIGAFATGLQYAILIVLVETLALDATLASTIGFVVSAGVNYLLNYHVTFTSRKSHLETAPKFATISGLGLALNALIMAGGTKVLHLHYFLVQLAATAIVLLWNFSGNYLWSFKETSRRNR